MSESQETASVPVEETVVEETKEEAVVAAVAEELSGASLEEEGSSSSSSSAGAADENLGRTGKKLIVEDEREHLNLVFIGHVDAGKSTLSGQILYVTGAVNQRTIEKYSREAKEKNRGTWFLAFIMDTNEEERAKGKTVEVGRAHFETAKKRYTILDAPGHRLYVPNMISGACQADVAILVISARRGEFETGFEGGGQTREHVTLSKTLGVRKLIVAINKMDDPSVNWAQERYDEIQAKLSPFFRSVGYNTKTDVTFVPVSGYSGSNIKDAYREADGAWYTGPTLFEVLDNLDPMNRNADGPLRIPILDRYRDAGCTVALGKIESGTVCVGDIVTIMPNRQQAEVVFLELDNFEVQRARSGENVNICLKDVAVTDLQQGFVICNKESNIPVVSKFAAQLAIIDLLPHKAVISAGYNAVMHVHTANEEISIGKLLRFYDKKTKQPTKKPPVFVVKGDLVEAIIELNRPICVEEFETLQQLGRFTLRDEGRTIAIGKITKIPKAALN